MYTAAIKHSFVTLSQLVNVKNIIKVGIGW